MHGMQPAMADAAWPAPAVPIPPPALSIPFPSAPVPAAPVPAAPVPAAPVPSAPVPSAPVPSAPFPAGGPFGGSANASPAPPAAEDALPPAQIAKLKKAAQDFEAMALGQMLAPMFNTVDTANSFFGGGAGEATFKPMMVDAIARQIAAHGGLGLAAPVYASLLHAQEHAQQAAAANRGIR